MMQPSRLILFSAIAVGALVPPPLGAQTAISTDGVIESQSGGFQFPDSSIQTTAAVAAGTPISAVPFTISQSGFYYFTGNLTMGQSGTAIDVIAGDVVIDLMGFTLDGADFADFGILATLPDNAVVVRNGTVRGFNTVGVILSTATYRVENIAAISNAGTGISGGSNGLVTRSLAVSNGNLGITVGSSSAVTHSTGAENGADGIRVNTSGIVRHSTARSNTGLGILAGDGGSVEFSTAELNGTDGISIGDGGSVIHSTARQNSDDGIHSGGGATIVGNASLENGSNGIFGASGDLILDNTLRGNNTNLFNNTGGIRVNGAGASIRGNTLTDNAFTSIFVFATDCVIDGNLLVGSGNGITFSTGNDGNFYAGNRASGNTGMDYNLAGTTQTDGGDNVSF